MRVGETAESGGTLSDPMPHVFQVDSGHLGHARPTGFIAAVERGDARDVELFPLVALTLISTLGLF